jgi:hypothetical protein
MVLASSFLKNARIMVEKSSMNDKRDKAATIVRYLRRWLLRILRLLRDMGILERSISCIL